LVNEAEPFSNIARSSPDDPRNCVIKASFSLNSPLRCRQISVSIGLSTHSHVPMAHGGYATT
jgi:hypothetical protein